MRRATRQLSRQPLQRLVPTPRPRSSLNAFPIRHESSQAGGNQQSGSASWSVPAAAVLVAAGAAYWVMNPPANKKLQAAHESTKTSGRVPDLDTLGIASAIPHAAVPDTNAVTEQLNEKAFSFAQTGTPGVSRYDGAQLASNAICEDAYVHGSFSNPFNASSNNWMAWGVFDGHVGWQTADLLTRTLVPYVRQNLGGISAKDGSAPSDEAVDAAIAKAFISLDDILVASAQDTIASNASLAEKIRKLEYGYAGSCSLLSLYDPTSRKLRVACTGDSRAVLGRQLPDGKWEAVALSVDQTGSNESEIARLNAKFPGEPEMIKGGRVWGIMVSRAFGDGMWKWASALKEKLRDDYNGSSTPPVSRFPAMKDGPYLTAEPVITTTQIEEGRKSFMILASDGLWDTMSDQQAVDLVGRWIDWQAGGAKKAVKLEGEQAKVGKDVLLGAKHECRFDEKRMTVQDGNAAVHLIRNGLGGGNDELVRAMLTSRYPISRDVRDDITVQVVLFDATK